MELTKENYELYASKHYAKNKWATTEDFKNDMCRFKYITRLVNRYYRDDDLKERLILNHITILGNMLGPAVTAKIVMIKSPEHLQSIMKTFLIFLNYLPVEDYIDVPLDQNLVCLLRKEYGL